MRRILFTGIVLACLAGSVSAADVKFGYKFAPGASERYHLKLVTEVTTAGMDVSQNADMTVKVTCASADKGSYAMSLVFEKVTASNVIAGTPQADPTASQMVGKSVNFIVDGNGNVSDITPGPGFDVWPAVQQVVEPTLKNFYVYLPAKAVPVGGKWKRENHRDTASSGAAYVTNEYFTFRQSAKEHGRDLAVVDQDVTTTVSGTSETPIGVFKLAGGGKGKFEFAYNPATGAIQRFKGTMDTTIDMTPQSGGTAMKTTVANHIERDLLE
jgi:hypothetical protein